METALTAATRVARAGGDPRPHGAGAGRRPTAHDLFAVLGALGLVGAQGVLVGIGPAIAEAMVAADVPMPRVRVFASVRAALEVCVRGAL
jgi:hypothetical protein